MVFNCCLLTLFLEAFLTDLIGPAVLGLVLPTVAE